MRRRFLLGASLTGLAELQPNRLLAAGPDQLDRAIRAVFTGAAPVQDAALRELSALNDAGAVAPLVQALF